MHGREESCPGVTRGAGLQLSVPSCAAAMQPGAPQQTRTAWQTVPHNAVRHMAEVQPWPAIAPRVSQLQKKHGAGHLVAVRSVHSCDDSPARCSLDKCTGLDACPAEHRSLRGTPASCFSRRAWLWPPAGCRARAVHGAIGRALLLEGPGHLISWMHHEQARCSSQRICGVSTCCGMRGAGGPQRRMRA